MLQARTRTSLDLGQALRELRPDASTTRATASSAHGLAMAAHFRG
jgi:hypothetical protein